MHQYFHTLSLRNRHNIHTQNSTTLFITYAICNGVLFAFQTRKGTDVQVANIEILYGISSMARVFYQSNTTYVNYPNILSDYSSITKSVLNCVPTEDGAIQHAPRFSHTVTS